MSCAPGGVRWLLAHELRLAWFNAGASSASASRRRPGTSTILLLGAVWIALHAGAWFVLRGLEGLDRRALPLLAGVTAALIVGATAMLSSSLKSSVVTLFERSDLDLLLSSPLPTRSIFTVRLAAIVAGTASLYLFLLAPFAHVGLLLGQYAWLGLYPAVLGVAVLCACCGMLLTLGLVRTIGVRRTRVGAQLLGALAGASAFILSQLYVHSSQVKQRDVGATLYGMLSRDGSLGPDSAAWLAARAILGEPLPALGLLALAAAVFAGTAGYTHRFFVHGLQQTVSRPEIRRAPAQGASYRFRRSLFETVIAKEWRLILRDPHLISQVLLQLLYLLPLFFVIFSKSTLQLPAIVAGLTLLCGSLAGSLAWIVISAEEAPDLLRGAPATRRTVRLAKLSAAVVPPLALVALPLLWLILRAPVAGLFACFSIVAAVWSAALVVLWCGRPGARSNFKGRGKGSFLSNFLEMMGNLCWGGLGGLLAALGAGPVSGAVLAGAGGALLGSLLVLLAAWLLRNRHGHVL